MDIIHKWFCKDKIRILGLAWIIFSIMLGLISTRNSVTLTNDDTYFYLRFNTMQESMGFFKTLVALALNKDIAYIGEMRTYGLSKALHFLLHQLAGDKAFIYQFVITFMNTLSGILIYKIFKKLKIAEMAAFIAVMVFTLNPFNHMQTFHHWTYLMLPLYCLLFYIYFEIKNIQKNSIYTFKNYLCSAMLIFSTVFTGEYTLSMLGCVICFFMIYNFIVKNRRLVITYAGHLVFELTLFVAWNILWKNVLTESDPVRFITKKPSLEYLSMITSAFVDNLKRFLFIGKYNKLNMGTDGNVSVKIMLAFIIIIGAIVLITYLCSKEKVKEYSRIPWKLSIPILVFTLSSFVVYLVMNVIYYAGMAIHYFYSIFSLLSMAFIILLFSIIKSKKSGIILGALVLIICSGYNIIWYAYITPTAGKIDREIVSNVEMAAKEGKEALLIETKDTVFGEVLLNSKCYRPFSSFSAGWASQTFLLSLFKDVVYITPNANIIDNYDGTITIEDEKMIYQKEYKDKLTLNKEDIFLMCNDKYTEKRTYYSNVDDFISKKNMMIYSINDKDKFNYNLVINKPLLYVDAGCDNVQAGYDIDKPFTEDNTGGITYGYFGDSSSYFWENSPSELGAVFATNRFSNTSFGYKFTGLPTDKNLMLVVDIMDHWHNADGERVIDIVIKTDSGQLTYKDVDTCALSINAKTGEKAPVRLAFSIPNTTQATITFITKQGYDVASIQGIGLLEK